MRSSRKFLAPLDGSTFAESALESAAALAEDVGAELLLLRVEHYATEVVRDEYGRTISYLGEVANTAAQVAGEYLDVLTGTVSKR